MTDERLAVIEACEEIVLRYARDKELYPETRSVLIACPDPLAAGRAFAEVFGVGPIRKNAAYCPVCRRAAAEGTPFEDRSTMWPWSE